MFRESIEAAYSGIVTTGIGIEIGMFGQALVDGRREI
jgi:hypothetical protein